MAVNIQGNNYGIAVDGDLNIEKLEFEFGKGVKSASGIHNGVENAEIIEESAVVECTETKQELTKDDCVKIALEKIIVNGVIVYKYDYAMIKMVLEQELDLYFNNAQSFVNYLNDIGITHLSPTADAINKISSKAQKAYPNWNWPGIDNNEVRRRNNVAKQFLSAYNKL